MPQAPTSRYLQLDVRCVASLESGHRSTAATPRMAGIADIPVADAAASRNSDAWSTMLTPHESTDTALDAAQIGRSPAQERRQALITAAVTGELDIPVAA